MLRTSLLLTVSDGRCYRHGYKLGVLSVREMRMCDPLRCCQLLMMENMYTLLTLPAL